jgi:hypothetical protein
VSSQLWLAGGISALQPCSPATFLLACARSLGRTLHRFSNIKQVDNLETASTTTNTSNSYNNKIIWLTQLPEVADLVPVAVTVAAVVVAVDEVRERIHKVQF